MRTKEEIDGAIRKLQELRKQIRRNSVRGEETKLQEGLAQIEQGIYNLKQERKLAENTLTSTKSIKALRAKYGTKTIDSGIVCPICDRHVGTTTKQNPTTKREQERINPHTNQKGIQCEGSGLVYIEN